MSSSVAPGRSFSWGWTLALVLVLLVGGLLRVLWIADMEYKGDERWTFERTQHAGRDEPYPWLGMPTSYDVRHPGGTIWIFLLLAWATGVDTPTGLGLVCNLLNVAAIGLVVLFAWVSVPDDEREPWLWAAALVAVNPIAVQLHRKIWPPSTLPFFVMLVLWAWWYRRHPLGAFLWGLSALLLAQIHPAGMFLAVALALWALVVDRRAVAWPAWVAGSLLGALALVPWLWYAVEEMRRNPISQRQWANLFTFLYWQRWLTEPFGLGLRFNLGDDFPAFWAGPVIGGTSTYLVAVLHGASVALMAWILLGWLRWALQTRPSARTLLVGDTATAQVQSAMLVGFGLVFTATLLPVQPHYMLMTFPLMFLWVARLALLQTPGRWMLVLLVLVQLALTLAFLAFIHHHPGPIQGDYGLPYHRQHP